MDQNPSKNFITEVMRKLTPQMGAQLLVEPNYEYIGLIIFKNGNRIYYRDTRFSINPHGSVEISKDKNYSNFFLKHFGYNIPEGRAFYSDDLNERLADKSNIEHGYLYAESLGFPVIIKPNNFSQGMFVTKIFDKEDYYEIANKIFKETSVLIVEKFYTGKDFRIVVLNGKIVAAYQMEALSVIGNGTNTVLELLQFKQNSFIESGKLGLIDFDDYRIRLRLKRNGLDLNSVIPPHQSLQILDNSNLSSGGIPYDYTQLIHPEYKELAIRITNDMGLKLCGVDIITDDISVPINSYVVNEINSAPTLEYFARMGPDQLAITEAMYLEILKNLEHL